MTSGTQRSQDNDLLTFQERLHLAKTLPKDEKQEMVIKTYLRNTQYHLKKQGKCLNCAFLNPNCICQSLDDLASGKSSQQSIVKPTIRFLVWMHYKERYRASNTGKLLLKLFPGSKCFIHALPDDYDEFSNIVRGNAMPRTGENFSDEVNRKESKAITICLYPSSDAIEAKDLLQMMKKEKQEPDSRENPIASYEPLSYYNRIDIVILDGTWKQARKLRRNCTPESFGKAKHKFDYIIPVSISPTELSRFCCRRQSRTDHISTIEAAATFLNELDIFEDCIVENMYTALELVCDAMDKQSHIYTMPYVKPTKNGINRIPKQAHWEA